MAREYIPDAVLGSAPGLEIRHRVGRLVPSEGGESAHSIARTTLSNKGLGCLPIAQKIRKGEYRYLDSNGKEITKREAMAMADGVAYYQEAVDPSKGRLRHYGTFVSEGDALTIVSASRASSDIADVRDLDWPDENLHSIKEDTEESEQNKAEQSQKSKVTRSMRASLIAIILSVAASAVSWPAKRQEVMLSSLGIQADSGSPLSPEIASLLKAEEMLTQEADEILSMALLDMPHPTKEESSSLEERKRQAAAEIDRILACRKETDILGSGPSRHQQKEFQRIALLLHPDKGLVPAGDRRASDALRLTFAARRRFTAKGRHASS